MAGMIPVCEPFIGRKELQYVTDCIKTKWISSKGKYVGEFEEKFSRYCGVKYGISTTNGTAALHLALASLGIGKGDEVIVPTFTMIASVNPIVYTGARPAFVDADPKTWCMDTSKIEEKITKNTKAILPVHIYGHPCDMDAIMKIAKEHGLLVIEDAAEAHGAEYKRKKVGSFGDAGCYSFYANKILTCGEGGMVITNNEELAEKARALKDLAFGEKIRFLHQYLGFNYRMTNIHAAIGLAQLENIDKLVEIRRKNAKLYNSFLKDVKGITLPPEEKWAKNVYWMYSILVEDDFGISRDMLMEKLKEKGIDTRTFFIPIHQQPVYPEYNGEKYPVADELSRKGINLPSGPTLKKEDIKYIVESIRS